MSQVSSTSLRPVHNRVATGGFAMTSGGESVVVLDAQAKQMFADMRDGNLS